MNTRIQDNNTNHGGSFLMGLITGSAIGAGLAVYFAPRLASELRQRVTDSTTDLRNAASEGLQNVATRVADVVDRVADVADDVTRRGQAVRDDVADAVGRGAHEVGRGAREVVRGAREVEQFAKASKTDHAPRDRDRCGRRWHAPGHAEESDLRKKRTEITWNNPYFHHRPPALKPALPRRQSGMRHTRPVCLGRQ